jgi:hypothetical protein
VVHDRQAGLADQLLVYLHRRAWVVADQRCICARRALRIPRGVAENSGAGQGRTRLVRQTALATQVRYPATRIAPKPYAGRAEATSRASALTDRMITPMVTKCAYHQPPCQCHCTAGMVAKI